MTKVVINQAIGGFRLSSAACELLIAWGVPVFDVYDGPGLDGPEPYLTTVPMEEVEWMRGVYYDDWFRWSNHRTHPLLVKVVEELGPLASEDEGSLVIVEIPDDAAWHLEEADCGIEWVAEQHRIWRLVDGETVTKLSQ